MAKSEMWGILSEAEAKRVMTWASHGYGTAVICNFCNELIQIGDSFIRKRRSGRKIRVNGTVVKYYHESCWKRLQH